MTILASFIIVTHIQMTAQNTLYAGDAAAKLPLNNATMVRHTIHADAPAQTIGRRALIWNARIAINYYPIQMIHKPITFAWVVSSRS